MTNTIIVTLWCVLWAVAGFFYHAWEFSKGDHDRNRDSEGMVPYEMYMLLAPFFGPFLVVFGIMDLFMMLILRLLRYADVCVYKFKKRFSLDEFYLKVYNYFLRIHKK